MPRYYFDMRDADGVVPDEEGMELGTMKAVQQEAAQALAYMARDAIGEYPNGPLGPDGDRGQGRQRAGARGQIPVLSRLEVNIRTSRFYGHQRFSELATAGWRRDDQTRSRAVNITRGRPCLSLP